MNQIKVLIVVAAMCVAALSQDASTLPPPVPSLPPVSSDSGAAASADSGVAAPANSSAAASADSGAATPAGPIDGAGTCWKCGLGIASCKYDSFTVPDGQDAAKYQTGPNDLPRPCKFCVVQKSEDPDHNIKQLYRGCSDYDPTNGGTMPSYTYEQGGVNYTVTSKVCNTALCNQN